MGDYDAALTNQSNGPANAAEQHHVPRQRDLELGILLPVLESARTIRHADIHSFNNTGVNAGHGWGHAQPPRPSGRHLRFYSTTARASNIVVVKISLRGQRARPSMRPIG